MPENAYARWKPVENSLKRLKVLNLSDNFITESGFALLIKRLAGHPTLEKVVMKRNYMDERLFGHIRSALPYLKKLRHFDFSENRERVNRVVVVAEVAALRKANVIVEVS